jgi:predicted nucleic acid-binding protein
MLAKPFIDTNVLVYAYTLDHSRNDRAAALIAPAAWSAFKS